MTEQPESRSDPQPDPSTERRLDGNRALRELIDEAIRRKQTFTEIELAYQVASRDLHQAVRRASEAGATRAALGRALGVSRERVVAMVNRANQAVDVTPSVTQQDVTAQDTPPPDTTN